MEQRRNNNFSHRRHNNRRRNGGNRNHYRRNDNRGNQHNSHDNNVNRSRAQSGYFPPPSILQEYEYAQEGAASRIIDMAEAEQKRRHQWEDVYTEHLLRAQRHAQFFGFVILFFIISATIYLTSIGKSDVAMVLSVSAFTSVVLSNLFAGISRKLAIRPPRTINYKENSSVAANDTNNSSQRHRNSDRPDNRRYDNNQVSSS